MKKIFPRQFSSIDFKNVKTFFNNVTTFSRQILFRFREKKFTEFISVRITSCDTNTENVCRISIKKMYP
jgi:hypothetical protein